MDSREDLTRATEELEEASRLGVELQKLRLTNPDSPRIKVLERQISNHIDSIQSSTSRTEEKLRERQEVLDRVERLSFDLQRQITTLCATLILALLALSEVFEETRGMRAAVGDASSAFAYSVAASIMAMLLSVGSGLDWSWARASSQAAWHERALGRFFEYVGTISSVLRIVASSAALWFLFNGLFDLAEFLSGV